MDIQFESTKTFKEEELQKLFLSVDWSSGHYPDKLVAAMKNYGSVFSAWDGNKLVGLISSMDDGVMNAYVHYLLVDPEYQSKGIGRNLVEMTKEYYKDYLRVILIAYNKEIEFYENRGFEAGDDKVAMFITSLWT